jgi:hypothetical protein
VKDRNRPLPELSRRLNEIRDLAFTRNPPRGWVDAAPYTVLLGSLYRQGETLVRMAEVSTLNLHTIERIVFGEARRIQARTAQLAELTARLLLDPP